MTDSINSQSVESKPLAERSCRHWEKGFCKLGETCGFRHDPEMFAIKVKQKQKPKLAGGQSRYALRSNSGQNRASALRRFVLDQLALLDALAGTATYEPYSMSIVDIACGQGELSFQFVRLNHIEAISIDPRPRRFAKAERTLRQGHFHNVIPPNRKYQTVPHAEAKDSTRYPKVIRSFFTFPFTEQSYAANCARARDTVWTTRGLTHEDDFVETSVNKKLDVSADQAQDIDAEHQPPFAAVSESMASAAAIVAMHPDQATEAALDLALHLRKPFFIVPCCTWSREFPKRKTAAGEPVTTYEQLLDYLQAKAPFIRRDTIDCGGKNVVLYALPFDYD